MDSMSTSSRVSLTRSIAQEYRIVRSLWQAMHCSGSVLRLQDTTIAYNLLWMAPEIRSHFLEGPAGKLEALLNVGEESATHAAVICHPHPLYGGTMHNKVVFNAMKALSGFGFPVLRFNFRGAGLSESTHDEGRGEVEGGRWA